MQQHSGRGRPSFLPAELWAMGGTEDDGSTSEALSTVDATANRIRATAEIAADETRTSESGSSIFVDDSQALLSE